MTLEISEYTHGDKAPFSDWLNTLDRPVKARIMTRIDRLRRGNFGDTKSVGEGVFELRISFGPGYRVYYGRQDREIVILLCGGDKGSQSSDITRAHAFWRDVNRSRNHGH
jgi:putative addiction module killer protein